MPAAKKKTTKKTTVTKKSASKKKPVKKSTVKKNKVVDPAPRIITISKKPAFAAEAEASKIELKPNPTLTHKPRSIDGMIGSVEFQEGVATPRLKIQPKTLQPKKPDLDLDDFKVKNSDQMADNTLASEEAILPEKQTDKDVVADLAEEEVQLDDPLTEPDPFEQILNQFDARDYHTNPQVKTAIEPDPVAEISAKNLVDESESPKVFDTKHYHVPIRSRALKTGGTYLFEFFVIVLLIALFVTILIDAEIYNPGFELPFDVI